MASFNKVILIGNLTATPELKQTQAGMSVTSFNIAINRRGKDGEQSCDFFTVVAWSKTAEFICNYFAKGQPILVCGRLQTRSWTDNQGAKHTATEVVADEATFVANKEQQSALAQPTQPAPANYGYAPSAYTGQAQPNFEEIPSDESLPF